MHGKTMREALNEVRSFRDATNEGGPGSGPQKSYKTIPKNETESEKDIRLDKATAVSKAANDKRISDAIKQFQKQDEKQKKKSGELKFRKYDTNEGGPGSGPQKGGKKQSSADIKKAYGILNDPRYKQGNYSGAAKAIDKLSPGLSNHPDVKNAMKRANETLDLPATGDTTTSNASQEDETVELDEAKLSTSQLDTLKQKYSGLRGSEKNGIQMDKLAKIMKRYPESMLDQLAGLDIPMVSKVAKAMTEEVAEGGPGSGPQKDGGSSKSDSEAEYKKTQDKEYKRLTGLRKKEQERQKASKGDYKKSSKAALALKKYKSKFSHLKNDPLKIPGASQHQKSGKNVRMNKVPKKFGGEYYDQEDREALAHRVKFFHLGGKNQTGKAPDWQLKKYGITDDGKLKKGWKPDDQLKA